MIDGNAVPVFYLGCTTITGGGAKEDVSSRMGKSKSAFGRLWKILMSFTNPSKKKPSPGYSKHELSQRYYMVAKLGSLPKL